MVECDPWIDLVATGCRFKVGHRRGKRYKISSSSAEDIPVLVVWFLICCSYSFLVNMFAVLAWQIEEKHLPSTTPNINIRSPPFFSLQLSPTPWAKWREKNGRPARLQLGQGGGVAYGESPSLQVSTILNSKYIWYEREIGTSIFSFKIRGTLPTKPLNHWAGMVKQ